MIWNSAWMATRRHKWLRLHELSRQYSDGREMEPTPLSEESGLTALQNEKGGSE